MSKLVPGNHTHLTLEDRQYIEDALNNRASFRAISRYLCKDPFTELAKEAKAIYRIRRIVLVNTEIIDEYMENFRDI